jgi:hypothetical protein
MAHHVDIICMPFNMALGENIGRPYYDEIAYLRYVLDEVKEKDIILFCPDPDTGFQWRPEREAAILISEFQADQRAPGFYGIYKPAKFVFPGISMTKSGDDISVRGSSLAAALAAALAATILYCTRLAEIIPIITRHNWRETGWIQDQIHRLHTCTGMGRVFQAIVDRHGSSSGQGELIPVWALFCLGGENMDHDWGSLTEAIEQQDALEAVMDVARFSVAQASFS